MFRPQFLTFVVRNHKKEKGYIQRRTTRSASYCGLLKLLKNLKATSGCTAANSVGRPNSSSSMLPDKSRRRFLHVRSPAACDIESSSASLEGLLALGIVGSESTDILWDTFPVDPPVGTPSGKIRCATDARVFECPVVALPSSRHEAPSPVSFLNSLRYISLKANNKNCTYHV